MKKLIHVLLCTQIAVTAVSAQNTALRDWENPEVFAINKEATCATALPCPSAQMATKDSYDSSPYCKSLDGSWKFKWSPRITDVPDGFYKENYNITGWGEIPVPRNWEFDGYGIAMLSKIIYSSTC